MFRKLLCLMFAMSCLISTSWTQIFSPARPLLSLKTEHFEFIFPAELESETRDLAIFGEAAYARIRVLLADQSNRSLIPVVLTPDIDYANGFASTTPYTSIVLYVTPTELNSTIGNFNHDLKSVFFHELVHAISLTIKNPFFEFFAGLFGPAIAPQVFTLPVLMIEGVTVSYESQDGFGRVNDPWVRQYLQQALLQNQFMSPWETWSDDQSYPFGSAGYWYGGFFNAYLQETFGHETYALLWKQFSSAVFLTGEPFLDQSNAIETVYGKSIEELWEAFKVWLRPDFPIHIQGQLANLDTKRISHLSGDGSSLYFFASSSSAVYRWTPTSKEPEFLFYSDGLLNRLDVSPDKSKLLVSTGAVEDGVARYRLRVFDLQTKAFTDFSKRSLSQAGWAGDAIVALRRRVGVNDLVLIDSNGTEQVLLAGALHRNFSEPTSVDGKTVYVIVRENGQRSILKIDAISKAIQIAKPDQSLGQIRYLSRSAASIWLSYSKAEGFYSPLKIDNNNFDLLEDNVSGGLFAVQEMADQSLWGMSLMAEGYQLSRFPQALSKKTKTIAANWQPYLVQSEQVDLPTWTNEQPQTLPTTGAYLPLEWMLPRLWFPLLSLDLEALSPALRADTMIGLTTYSSDPALTENLLLELGFYPKRLFTHLSINYQNRQSVLSSSLTAKDILLSAAQVENSYRQSSFQLEFARPIFADLAWQQVTPYARLAWAAEWDYLAGLSSAYEWPLSHTWLNASLGFRFSSNNPGNDLSKPNGSFFANLNVAGALDLLDSSQAPWLVSANISTSLPVVPFDLDLQAAWSPQIKFGPRGVTRQSAEQAWYGLFNSWQSYAEFAHLPILDSWFVSADLGYRLFDLEFATKTALFDQLLLKGLRIKTGLRGLYLGQELNVSSYLRAIAFLLPNSETIVGRVNLVPYAEASFLWDNHNPLQSPGKWMFSAGLSIGL